jgi:hypothetical protein
VGQITAETAEAIRFSWRLHIAYTRGPATWRRAARFTFFPWLLRPRVENLQKFAKPSGMWNTGRRSGNSKKTHALVQSTGPPMVVQCNTLPHQQIRVCVPPFNFTLTWAMTVYNIVTTLIPRPSRLALLRMVAARQAQSPAYATGWRNSRVLLPVPCKSLPRKT